VGQSDHWLSIPLAYHSKLAVVVGSQDHMEYGAMLNRMLEAYCTNTPVIVDAEFDKYSDMYKSYPYKFDHPSDIPYLVNSQDFCEGWQDELTAFIKGLGNFEEELQFLLGIDWI
jgi:hypothetical protein